MTTTHTRTISRDESVRATLRATDAKKPHVERIDWISSTFIFLPPVLVAIAYFVFHVPVLPKTLALGLVFYAINGFGVTAGYHRLFSHRAFTAHWTLQALLACWGAGAFQGSIKWWGRNHRIHHRYVDTNKDPYNAKRGFLFTHIGWMLLKRDPSLYGRVDSSDLKSNKIIMFQHRHYLPIAFFFGLGLPTLIAGLGWGDFLGGYIYAGLLKMVLVHHSTFFINSLAHTSLFGATQNYSDNHSSHDSWLCALVTLGEGYHNFHHEFAQDYRNGVMWYHFDPTKWFIRACEMVGAAWGLVRIPNEVIKRNRYNLDHKRHAAFLAALEKKIASLEEKVSVPESYSWEEFENRVAKGAKLIVIGNYVLDMEKRVPTGAGYTHKSKDINWYNAHPGGRNMLDMFIGKDATMAISGQVYKHSDGAFNLFQHLRVAKIERDSDAPDAEPTSPYEERTRLC